MPLWCAPLSTVPPTAVFRHPPTRKVGRGRTLLKHPSGAPHVSDPALRVRPTCLTPPCRRCVSDPAARLVSLLFTNY
ncbi:MAG: hypothetical protein LBK25_07335 [Treponema sp.]|nr:hypothetical protein [Treponema sp.]